MTRRASRPFLATLVLVLATAGAGAQSLPPEGADAEPVAQATETEPSGSSPTWLINSMLAFAVLTASGFGWVTLQRSRARAHEMASRSAWNTVDMLVSAQSTASPTPARARRDLPASLSAVQAQRPRSMASATPAFGRRA